MSTILGWTKHPPTQALQTVNSGLRNGRKAWAGGTSPIWLCSPHYGLSGRGMADAFLFTLRAQRPYPPRIPTFGPARFFALEAQSSKIFGASKCLQNPFSPACSSKTEREGSESSTFACYICYMPVASKSPRYTCYVTVPEQIARYICYGSFASFCLVSQFYGRTVRMTRNRMPWPQQTATAATNTPE